MSDGIRAMWMRGGTSKGGFFLAEDLPQDTAARDQVLLSIMGSPDPRQIDGLGGADPLTSKVAVVRASEREGVDIDYLFLQVFVDQALVTDKQNCGNMLAAVGPFAIERGLVKPQDGETRVRIFMENTSQVAVATIATPGGIVRYDGIARIDGVPGSASPIPLLFRDTAGSTCGALLPTGNTVDRVEGVEVTLIDNGMPCVILHAEDVGIAGNEDRETLDNNAGFKARVEKIRLAAGPLMKLGDVAEQSVPKMVIVAPPEDGGTIMTRCLIPHRVHASIGVLAAVTVATACLLEGSPAAVVANLPSEGDKTLVIEHPTGTTPCVVEVDEAGNVAEAGMVRTARKLFDGPVFAREPVAEARSVADGILEETHG